MYKIKKVKYSAKEAKRMYSPHFWRVFENGKVVGDAQTKKIAERWVSRLNKRRK